MKIFEIVSDRITDQKLDRNNYLHWKWVIDIYVTGREKTSHLLADPPTLVTDAWTLDDNILIHQILTTIGLKV